jgi:ribonuclease P protein subunit POP4
MKLNPCLIVGKETEIIKSKNNFDLGTKGKIIDETRSTIIIKTNDGNKVFLKKNIVLTINNKSIDGKSILKRPEERLKGR